MSKKKKVSNIDLKVEGAASNSDEIPNDLVFNDDPEMEAGSSQVNDFMEMFDLAQAEPEPEQEQEPEPESQQPQKSEGSQGPML